MSGVGASKVIGLGLVGRLKMKIFQGTRIQETFSCPPCFGCSGVPGFPYTLDLDILFGPF